MVDYNCNSSTQRQKDREFSLGYTANVRPLWNTLQELVSKYFLKIVNYASVSAK
jgi:hypothetical protein